MNTLVVDMSMRQFFSFPSPVNETSARLVALGVVVQAVAFLVIREGWLLAPLVFGFAARVLTGPTLSPLGQLSVRVATPFVEQRLGVESRHAPGPPKRFAQAIGLAFTTGAAIGWMTGTAWLTFALLGGLLVAASLEAFAAICLGCIAFAAIWVCEDCDDISERLQQAMLRSRATVPATDVLVADARQADVAVDQAVPTRRTSARPVSRSPMSRHRATPPPVGQVRR